MKMTLMTTLLMLTANLAAASDRRIAQATCADGGGRVEFSAVRRVHSEINNELNLQGEFKGIGQFNGMLIPFRLSDSQFAALKRATSPRFLSSLTVFIENGYETMTTYEGTVTFAGSLERPSAMRVELTRKGSFATNASGHVPVPSKGPSSIRLTLTQCR